MNQWTSQESAAWVADELGLSATAAAAVAEEFEAKEIEGDGLLGNMKRVEKVIGQTAENEWLVGFMRPQEVTSDMSPSVFEVRKELELAAQKQKEQKAAEEMDEGGAVDELTVKLATPQQAPVTPTVAAPSATSEPV